MRKWQGLLLLLVLSVLVVTGCAKEDKANTGISTDKNTESTEKTEEKPENKNESIEESKVEEREKIEIKVAALRGATAIGMIKMIEDAEKGITPDSYTFTIAGAADEVSAGLIKGEFDIAAIPCNLASVLYNKTEGMIKLMGINTLGVLYIVETKDSIRSVEDLRGKTIYSTGYGTTPQYTLNYLLNSYGINPEKDVTIEYKTEATEVAAILSEAEDAIAMLPQPYVTTVMMNNDKVRIALDIAKEWDAVNTEGMSVVTGVVVVRKEFLENNKEAVEAFMEEYRLSASYVNNDIEAAALLLEKHDIFKAAVAKKAIPFCNISMIQGQDMKEKVNGYLSVLYDQNPQSVGGKLPDDAFYYIP